MRVPSIRVASALAAGLLGFGAAVDAQTFSGAGPARVFALPGTGEPTRAPEPRGPALRRLPSVAASLRLSGEQAEIVWPFYATADEARAGGRFVVGYLSAVSVLPEASSMTLALNGEALGARPVDGARGLREAAFSVPPGRLVQGWNALRLSVSQRHRVDCSIEATYELWTQIDPQSTGFTAAAGPAIAEPADLAGLDPAADGAVAIRLVQAGRMPERAVEDLLGALQEVTLAGRFAQVSADFGPAAGGAGLNLAVGTAEALAPALPPAALGPVEGARLALLPATPERRATLVATGRSEGEVSEALRALARLRAAPPRGTPAGLRALADMDGHRVEGGDRVSLADLGIADAHVGGRVHRVAFDLALPHDVLSADYAKVVLDLAGGYGPGLAPGAKIIVEVNGRNAASAELRGRGEAMTGKSVFLPLGLMRPGLNRVVLTALLPRAADAACAGGEGAQGERLFLSAATALTLPPLARIGRQPDLGQTFAAGFPYAVPSGAGTRRPTLAVSAPDRDTMAAAATLVARLARAAGAPLPFAFAAGRAVPAGPVLAVSPAPALDAGLLAQVGLDAGLLATGEPAAPDVARGAARRRLARSDDLAACRGPAADPGKALALAGQAVTGPAPDDVLTVVTAASPALLEAGLACLVHPRVWPSLRGRLAALAGDGTVRSTEAEAPRYVVTAPLSPGNLRRIAAGWLSLHAGLYGGLALLVAACLALSTHRLVTNLGRKSS